MRRIVRIAWTSGLAAALLCASPALAQGETAKKKADERQAEQGPVVNLPQSATASSDSFNFKMGSDPASAITGSSGPLGHGFWGVVSDPKKDAERRVRKLIERLG